MTKVLVLGCGYAGREVARLARARGLEVRTTVRDPARALALRAEGFEVLQTPTLEPEIAEHVDEETHVVVTFPPDGATDQRIAPHLRHAYALTYVSSTGVYGEHGGTLDDDTPLPTQRSERVERLLSGEAAWRARGACVLRCPALYGPERGLHARILAGKHRIPGDGSRMISRIHIADLAQLVLATGAETIRKRGETFVVGDLEPAPHIEVVRFICRTFDVPLPPSLPLEAAPESLRVDRKVDGTRALRVLGVQLRYPSYREGMSAENVRVPRA